MQIPILYDIVLIFGLAIFVSVIFHRFKIPGIIGFLFTGILAGPHILKFTEDSHHEIEVLAEIGVILLLFTIGIEFSLKRLLKIKRIVFLGGFLQVGLTCLFTALIFFNIGISLNESIFMGFLAALSSTAIVMKLLQEKGDVSESHGKTSLGILIFQDIIIVVMILFTPILAGKGGDLLTETLILIAKAAGVLIFMFVAYKYIIPFTLKNVVKTQNKELFLLTIIATGFALAWLTASIGLSLAFGAFLAGLAISETDYSHHAFGNVIPFRDIFSGFFFVSIGMLLDVNFFLEMPFLIIAIAIGVIISKTIINGFVAYILGLPFKTTVIVGLTLSQIGEFSFILAKQGETSGFLATPIGSEFTFYQLFLAVTIITMAAAPFIVMLAPQIADFAIKHLPFSDKFLQGRRPLPVPEIDRLSNHIVIAGMGLHGHHIAHAAKRMHIPYIIIENDYSTVVDEQKKGEPVLFGDATKENILEKANIKKAEVITISIADIADTYAIVHEARKMNPGLYIIVRTRLVNEMPEILNAGANKVIPEEYETSIEIFVNVMHKYLVPQSDIDVFVGNMRKTGYSALREENSQEIEGHNITEILQDVDIVTIRIDEKSSVINQSLKEMALRQNYGVNLLAIKRGADTISNPTPNEKLCENDILFIMGSTQEIQCAQSLFKEASPPDCNKIE